MWDYEWRWFNGKGDDLLKFASKHKLHIGKIEDLISYRLRKENLIKLKKTSTINLNNQKFKIYVFENSIDGSEHFALVKGKVNKSKSPRVRVISSNVVQNYLINQKLPNSFEKTLKYFKNYGFTLKQLKIWSDLMIWWWTDR